MKVSSARSNIEWRFVEHALNTRENEQTQEEFFSSEKLTNEVAYLVRESIQNSLDERLDNSKPVRVKFTVGIQSAPLLKQYFGDLLPHAKAVALINAPSLERDAKYLVIEDFNTKGLEGSTSSTFENLTDAEKNARGFGDSFWFFEWKTGKSNKSSGKRGSWGVGKIVFPRASALKAYLVLSERQQKAAPDGDTQILFGHSILNYRTIGDKRYVPDCQWMAKEILNEDDANRQPDIVPSKDSVECDQFRKDWNLARKQGEFGTSIVVPFVNELMDASQLLHSIVQDYFVAILSGMLVCEVEDPSGHCETLSASTIIPFLTSRSGEETDGILNTGEMLGLCQMYAEHLKGKTSSFEIAITRPTENDWACYNASEEFAAKFKEEFDAGKILNVKINTVIPRAKESDSNQGEDFFIVLMQKSEDSDTAAVFSREGILITEANPEKYKGVLSLVLVGNVSDSDSTQQTLATLLKRAEGPSHAKWSKEATHFKSVYTPQVVANRTIQWVKYSVRNLFKIIRQEDNIADATELAKFFPDDDLGRRPGPSHPKVVLSAKKSIGNPRNLEISWTVHGANQDEYVLSIISPDVEVIDSGKDVFSTFYEVPREISDITFQVEVKGNSTSYLSNKKRVLFYTLPNLPQLVLDRRGDSAVVLAEDISAITAGMQFNVEFGYEVRGGNTFSTDTEHDLNAYALYDASKSHGATISVGAKQNSILVKVDSPDFELYFRGFNKYLDPAINANYIEGAK